jgi:hypothetical protein
MAEINLQVEVADKGRAEEIARQIREQLQTTGVVAETEMIIQQPRSLAGVMVTIGSIVIILKHGADLLDATRRVVRSLTELLKDLRDLEKVFVEIGDSRVPLGEVNDEKLKALAGEA